MSLDQGTESQSATVRLSEPCQSGWSCWYCSSSTTSTGPANGGPSTLDVRWPSDSLMSGTIPWPEIAETSLRTRPETMKELCPGLPTSFWSAPSVWSWRGRPGRSSSVGRVTLSVIPAKPIPISRPAPSAGFPSVIISPAETGRDTHTICLPIKLVLIRTELSNNDRCWIIL